MTRATIDEAKRRRAEKERAAREPSPDVPKKTNGHAPTASRFKLLGLNDLDAQPDDDWLIDGLLPRKGVGVLYGRWKSFKSFVALDLAWAIADQQRASWAGRTIKRHAVVIYVVCEGQSGMRKRLLAYKLGRTDDELPSLYRIEQRPMMGLPRSGDVGELVNAIKAGLPHDEVGLVIVDTLARTLGGTDENNEGMRNFLDNAEDLSERLDCLVFAVHHEGAAGSDRPRGGTTLPAGVVVTWHVKRQRGQGLRCKLIVEEAKDSVSDHAFDVTLRKYEFGDEHDERRESTLIVEAIAPIETVAGGEGADDAEVPIFLLALDEARNLVINEPQEKVDRRKIPTGASVGLIDRLRDVLIDAGLLDVSHKPPERQAQALSGAWRDLRVRLQKRQLIKIVDKRWFYLIEKPRQ